MKQKPSSDNFSHLRWNPFLSLLWREIRRYLKVVFQTVMTPLVNSALYLLIFGVSLGSSIQLQSGIPYLAFLIPGLVMMACLNNAFQNASSSIVSGKFSGDVEDWKVVPLSPSQIVWALSFGGLIRGLMVAALTFLVGQVFMKVEIGEYLGIHSPMTLLFFLMIGGLAFAKIGLIAAFYAKTFDQMSAIGAFVITPLIFLGGVFFSLENLSEFWQNVSLYNPMLYFINGVRYAVLGQTDVPLVKSIVVSCLSLVAFHAAAYYSVKNGRFQRW